MPAAQRYKLPNKWAAFGSASGIWTFWAISHLLYPGHGSQASETTDLFPSYFMELLLPRPLPQDRLRLASSPGPRQEAQHPPPPFLADS